MTDSRSAWARMRASDPGHSSDLAALDADPAVLDHVDATPAVSSDGVGDGADQLGEGLGGAVERDGDAGFERHDELHGSRGAVAGSAVRA